jgi:predicted nucleic acid-binding protein
MAASPVDFQGDVISLDTNVLIGLVDTASDYHAACVAFFQRLIDPDSPIRLFTAPLTLDEVIFVLWHEMLVREPYNITRSRSQYLRDHPEIVRVLMEHIAPLVEAIGELVTLEPVMAADTDPMRHEMLASGLLPRDAIHLAVMKRLGLTAIASGDEGFGNRRDIALLQP